MHASTGIALMGGGGAYSYIQGSTQWISFVINHILKEISWAEPEYIWIIMHLPN